jgi:hypothetical protein
MSPPSSSRRKPRDSASLSTDDNSPRFTPSPRSSRSSDGLAVVREPASIELRPISSRREPVSKELEAEAEADADDQLPYARRASLDSAQSYELYTPDEDLAVLRKLDRRLVAFMALLYCLSFLDRSSE